MFQLFVRYYPYQEKTQFIGDLFVGVPSRNYSRFVKILKELKASGSILLEISPLKNKKDPFESLDGIKYESFRFLEWKYAVEIDKMKLERSKNSLKINLNPYTLHDTLEILDNLKGDICDYGLDAYELTYVDGKVERINRRVWFMKLDSQS